MSSRRHRFKHHGWERALSHIAAAGAFSAEVDGTDRFVKEVFFRLSGAALEALYGEYGRRYGPKAAGYAREAREKWRRGEVKMSGVVSQRLYALVPPFMSAAEKKQVVHVLWRRYATRSHRYLYVGPDASESEVMTAVERHFVSLLSLGNLPLTLTSRFQWLTDNDAVATRRLLANFVDEQKAAALTAGRANVTTMISAMRARAARNIDSVSHTITVGNQALTLKADPLRTGVLLSESAFARTKPTAGFSIGGLIGVAAVVVILFVLAPGGTASHSYDSGTGGGYSGRGGYGGGGYGYGNGGVSNGRYGGNGNAGGGSEAIGSATGNTGAGESSSGNRSVDVSGTDRISPSSLVADASPQRASSPAQAAAAVRKSATASESVTSAGPRLGSPKPLKVSAVTVTSLPPKPAASMLAPGSAAAQGDRCASRRVARVGSDGYTVDLDDGEHIAVSAAALMHIAASQWSTGDDVVVCAAADSTGTTAVSVEVPRHYAKIQGTLAYTGRRRPVSCSRTAVRSMDDDGRLLQTTDGSTFEVSANGLMRIEAGQWSTADDVVVCTARLQDGEIAAGITNPAHFSSVQATRSGVSAVATVSCWTSRVVAVAASGQRVELSGHETYVISTAGLMRITVSQWTTGEAVRVCSSKDRSGAAASIENPERYAKVQARRRYSATP